MRDALNILKPWSTTGIGSLPHQSIDAALEFSFSFDLPFLPQLPKRDFREYMIPQALECLPGLQVGSEGEVNLDPLAWSIKSRGFLKKLNDALSGDAGRGLEFSNEVLQDFLPSTDFCRSWQPFLWELRERDHKICKIQMAGPVTVQWYLSLKWADHHKTFPELQDVIRKVIFARALAMVIRLKKEGLTPLIFLDEPGLFATGGDFQTATLDLTLLTKVLRKAGALVGVHCCASLNEDPASSEKFWNFKNDVADILSFDWKRSSQSFFNQNTSEDSAGFAFGVVPTDEVFDVKDFVESEDSSELRKQKNSSTKLLTPACGLAFLEIQECEKVLSNLREIRERL